MALAVDYNKKSIVIVSGASRGIGKTIAISLAERLNQNSVFLLLARSESGLKDTRDEILAMNSNFNVKYKCVDFNYTDLSLYEAVLDEFVKSIDLSNVAFAYCFHNAGDICVIKKALKLTDVETWKKYFDVNLYSAVLLNSKFVEKFTGRVEQLVIVNISSFAGKVPYKNLGMYGSTKASREIYFKVLALEEPDYIVLNYSPGSVDTDMFSSIIESAETEAVRKMFQYLKDSCILTTDQTVEKLLEVLKMGNYESGAAVDYYDKI